MSISSVQTTASGAHATVAGSSGDGRQPVFALPLLVLATAPSVANAVNSSTITPAALTLPPAVPQPADSALGYFSATAQLQRELVARSVLNAAKTLAQRSLDEQPTQAANDTSFNNINVGQFIASVADVTPSLSLAETLSTTASGNSADVSSLLQSIAEASLLQAGVVTNAPSAQNQQAALELTLLANLAAGQAALIAAPEGLPAPPQAQPASDEANPVQNQVLAIQQSEKPAITPAPANAGIRDLSKDTSTAAAPANSADSIAVNPVVPAVAPPALSLNTAPPSTASSLSAPAPQAPEDDSAAVAIRDAMQVIDEDPAYAGAVAAFQLSGPFLRSKITAGLHLSLPSSTAVPAVVAVVSATPMRPST